MIKTLDTLHEAEYNTFGKGQNMNIREIVEDYRKNLQAIADYFENSSMYHAELMLDEYWAVDGENLGFDSEPFTPENSANYSYSIRNGGKMFWRKPEYCLAYVDNGCGQEFYILLDSRKEIK